MIAVMPRYNRTSNKYAMERKNRFSLASHELRTRYLIKLASKTA